MLVIAVAVVKNWNRPLRVGMDGASIWHVEIRSRI